MKLSRELTKVMVYEREDEGELSDEVAGYEARRLHSSQSSR